MLISRAKDQLIITVEDIFEWMELFDNGLDNELMFELDGDNLEFFCPGWESYIDKDKPFDTLKVEDATQVKCINIMIAEGLENLDGEGMYEVVSGKFELAKEVIEEEGDDPNYDAFLSYVGNVTYKVTPDLPEV